MTQEIDYLLTLFDVGEYKIPPAKAEIADRDGTRRVIESREIPVTVLSVLGKTEVLSADIRDIRGVTRVVPQYEKFLRAAAVAAAVAGALFLIFALGVFIRKKFGLFKPLLNPYEEALQEFGRLETNIGKSRSLDRSFYERLSAVLRRYIERRIGVMVSRLTAAEAKEVLSRLELSEGLSPRLCDLWDMLDMAKFALWKPEPDGALLDLNETRLTVTALEESQAPPAAETESSR
jgi:hypothetical protein